MKIKRYDPTFEESQGMCEHDDGEYVSHGDFMRVFKVVSQWNNGITPIGYDGVIMITVEEYNALVNALNGVHTDEN